MKIPPAIFGHPLFLVALSTLGIYLFLIIAFRIVGRRQLGQLTVIDLVIIIVMGSAVETAMVHGNTSLSAGLVSAGTLVATNKLLTTLACRSKRMRHLINGGPIVLINHGHIVEERLKRVGLTIEDLTAALHARGYCEPSEIKFAIMEEDGAINVIPIGAPTLRHDRNLRQADAASDHL